MRRWLQSDPSLEPLVERAWLLHRARPPTRKGGVKGPVELVADAAASMKWTWSTSPWAFEREEEEPVALAGGPNGAFTHAVREGLRKREAERAEHRRPELAGFLQADRRVVYRALRWKSKEHKHTPGPLKGIMKGILTGAGTYQRHLRAAGLADSGQCPFCDEAVEEDVEHALWHCSAWADTRERLIGSRRVNVTGLPAITRNCGILCEAEAGAASGRELDGPAPPPDSRPWTRGEHDDTFVWGRRCAYMDGSCKGSTGPRRYRRAGFGVGWGHEHPDNAAHFLSGSWQSSQRAELSAILHAVCMHADGPLYIRSDSEWSLAGTALLLSGLPPDARWEHGDLWQSLAAELAARHEGCPVSVEKVKAHARVPHPPRAHHCCGGGGQPTGGSPRRTRPSSAARP